MAVVNNSTASIIGHGAGNITLGGAGTGTSWSTGLSIQPHNVKANMIMDVFRRDAGFKDMADMYDTYASMAKLQNKTIDELLVENFNRWKEETNYEY